MKRNQKSHSKESKLRVNKFQVFFEEKNTKTHTKTYQRVFTTFIIFTTFIKNMNFMSCCFHTKNSKSE